ncbi:uncharacterized protein (DUF2336 family) [Breoghania corrubedonensis]|uniref:Uncharacterized protein (DUF2336 family) n=1 Tax=Breoghania corrubedonensis TaxID=665038 RepID=A0A2T5VCY7_9HYPH|nr:DUF2336 domain-containing protein [Breoghania corrubedonensis]PTW61629.1 uncharacterized protein (DUF2336 family) [Breoghania corrubedonensis]
MFIRNLLCWMETAPDAPRADAAQALARAYLTSDLDREDRADAEAAMTWLLDDVSPCVRAALADTLADSADAPRHVILSLANDIPPIASLVLMRSPLFLDAELIDFAALGDADMQMAVARRPSVSAAVAASLAETGVLDACLELLANPAADLRRGALERLVERFDSDAELRRVLMTRAGVPLAVKQKLVAQLAEQLCRVPAVGTGLKAERARTMLGEARDRITVAMARDADRADICGLVVHLRESAQLTPTLLLRALCTGNMSLFIAAMSDLGEMPGPRVETIVINGWASSLRALFKRAGLPPKLHSAFETAVLSYREIAAAGEPLSGFSFTRRMIETVLDDHAPEEGFDDGLDTLRRLLRRLESESARESARLFVRQASLPAA